MEAGDADLDHHVGLARLLAQREELVRRLRELFRVVTEGEIHKVAPVAFVVDPFDRKAVAEKVVNFRPSS
jgi:hypothetical protein